MSLGAQSVKYVNAAETTKQNRTEQTEQLF